MAEAHPVGFAGFDESKGARRDHHSRRSTIFHGRARLADLGYHRAGSDIVFLAGSSDHLIENDLFFREYVVHYTTASCIVCDEYRTRRTTADGYFSGWNEEKRAYEATAGL